MHPTRTSAVIPTELPTVVGSLSDSELEDRLRRLAAIEHTALALLLAHLGEFDQRRLHSDQGQPSLFSYCMRVLGYSEQAAYKRIQAARAARAHPVILQRLAEGSITLTAVVILSPHLRVDNVMDLLASARGRRTCEIEALAAGLAPRPDSPDCLRALPSPSGLPSMPEKAPCAPQLLSQDAPSPSTNTPTVVLAMPPRERIEPLSEQRHLFRFTACSALRAKYERARELLASSRSRSSMESVIEAGLDALLDKLAPERRIARRRARVAHRDATDQETGSKANPHEDRRPASRRIAASLRDAVWERDEGRCTFVGPDGARCPATSRLEIDHIRPYALGGPSDDAANLRLMCRAHNQLLARRAFGAVADPSRKSLGHDYP